MLEIFAMSARAVDVTWTNIDGGKLRLAVARREERANDRRDP
jgi:hypothetical protein